MLKKKSILIILGIVVLAAISAIYVQQKGLYTFWGSNSVERIDSTSAQQLIEDKSPLIIDARTIEEFETSHLEQAMRFEPSILNSMDKKQPILIYCTVGVRSNRLAKQLSDAGFREVYDMKDGIIGWANNAQPVIDSSNELTDRIHTYNKSVSPLLKKGTPVY